MSSVLSLSASGIAASVARGELSALEAAVGCIRRIEAVDGRLNAVVVRLFDEALLQARAADARRARGESLGPLHGVPFTVKEMFDVAGMPTTAGLARLAGIRAAKDAPVVHRLREAGAIVLGKTNVPQLGMFFESENPLYGLTESPWSRDRSPGGSSGGEAAIIAAGGSPLGLGSDAGGSIRQPAHACGICGLKPTALRLGMEGHFTLPNWLPEWIQPGPMARVVEDLALAMDALASPAAAGVPAWPSRTGKVSEASLRKVRVGVYEDDGYYRACPGARRAVREAAQALRERGVEVEEFQPPAVMEGLRIYFALFLADGLACMRRLVRGSPRDWRIRKPLTGALAPTILRGAGAWVLDLLGRRYEAQMARWASRRVLSSAARRSLVEEQAGYQRRFMDALEARRLDALLCPPSGLPALRHGCYYSTFAGSYTILYNLLGFPAGVVPVTRVREGEESDRSSGADPVSREASRVEAGSAGLPLGVQVAALPWREDIVLGLMAAIEEGVRGGPDFPRRPVGEEGRA
ncbi:MAG TPA: amidase family protein [Planctomycetota bacterium]|nr:amidase family protein [Planctomycetota bacterium]